MSETVKSASIVSKFETDELISLELRGTVESLQLQPSKKTVETSIKPLSLIFNSILSEGIK